MTSTTTFDPDTLDRDTRSIWNMVVDAIAVNESEGSTDTFTYRKLVERRDDIIAGQRFGLAARIDRPAEIANALPAGPDRSSPATAAPRTGGAKASDAQCGFITRLLNERQLPDPTTTRGGMLAHVNLFQQGELSGKSASQLIDWLLTLPVVAPREATPKQIASCIRESERRVYNNAPVDRTVERVAGAEFVSFDDAKHALDVLFAAPFRPRDDPSELPAGMYRTPDGTIFRVQRAVHGSGRMYAKQLVVVTQPERDEQGRVAVPAEITFERAPGAINRLTLADRMSLDEAKHFGSIYGVCCKCGAVLTDEQSIAEGIGPVCGRRDNWK